MEAQRNWQHQDPHHRKWSLETRVAIVDGAGVVVDVVVVGGGGGGGVVGSIDREVNDCYYCYHVEVCCDCLGF